MNRFISSVALAGLMLISIRIDAAPAGTSPTSNLNSVQHARADQLIEVFENETLTPQYGYIENLGDGRGYTAGRAGFCSATGDLLLVVDRYTAQVPGNVLAKYLGILKTLANNGDDDISGLEGFVADWQSCANDPYMRMAQDSVVSDLNYIPAMQLADQLGVRFPLTLAALYEAVIQHGMGTDPDGVPAIVSRATTDAGGIPLQGVDEKVWLLSFLKMRREDLLNSYDPATRAAWQESVGRADTMIDIFNSNNFQFTGPITVSPYGDTFTVP